MPKYAVTFENYVGTKRMTMLNAVNDKHASKKAEKERSKDEMVTAVTEVFDAT